MADPALGYRLAQQGVNLNSTDFRYPRKKLNKQEDYIKIECLEYQPPGINTDISSFFQPSSDTAYSTTGTKTIRGTIILPIPDNLPTNGNAVNWGESRLGPLQTAGVGVANETIQKGFFKGADALKTAITAGVKALQTGTGQKMTQSFFSTKAVEALLGQDDDLFATVLGRTTGAVFNENVELLFRGITLRDGFSFQFNLTPRFKEEAEHVRQMIIFLKKEMSAKRGLSEGAAAGLFLKAPSVFKVQYMSGNNPHPYLNQFKICAMNSLSLNFTGSNTYSTYSDGTPVHMQLTLSFQELTPIYDRDYDNALGTGY